MSTPRTDAPRADDLLTQLQVLAQELAPEARLALIEHLTGASEGRATLTFASDPHTLRVAYDSYAHGHEFAAGQLVRWKAGLRNKRLPEYGQLAVVMGMLDETVINATEPADSPYYREPLDLVLGVVEESGDLACYHFDSHRFEPAAET